VGLRILHALVDELNIPTTGRTLTQHRKTAVSFRDVSLFPIFKLGLSTLTQLHGNAIQASPAVLNELTLMSLNVSASCLGFDFIGTNPDESAEDVGTIQVPSTWRVTISDPTTIQLFLHFYANTVPPTSSKALECVILLTSIRRSLFSTDSDRTAFLSTLMTGITGTCCLPTALHAGQVAFSFLHSLTHTTTSPPSLLSPPPAGLMSTHAGLEHAENYHQFCRLLGRLKANYQLSELVKATSYLDWLSLCTDFTIKSCENWQLSTNSIHYLLALWGRLVAAVPYVRPDAGPDGHSTKLEESVVVVIKCYIESMLGSVPLIVSDGVDDPLDDEGSLKDQLERLPVICRFQYAPTATFIVGQMDDIMGRYQTTIATLSTYHITEAQQEAIAVIEGQLAWLVYIIGAVVGGHSWSTTHLDDGEEIIDASLSRRVFQLVQLVDFRCCQSQGQMKSDSKLEQAFLFYFQNFRRVYMFMWDQHSIGGSPKIDHAPTTKQKIYQRMFENMGMGDHTAVANLIITKVSTNLKYWPNDEDVVRNTLELFYELASGYSSSKLLLSLDTVRTLLQRHTAEYFPFLAVPSNVRHRTSFHVTLTRLLFSSTPEEMPLSFDAFIEPVRDTLAKLGSLSNAELRSEGVKSPLIGVLRDLRGIASSLHNRRTYLMLFDALFPSHFPLLTRIAEVWYDEPAVTTSLLKFTQEFVYNKANRVNFDQSSPNGILLFRTTSDIVCSYGRNLLTHATSIPEHEIYKKKYKGLGLALDVLVSALSGNYVCFGVFALYNDPVLDNALDVALKLVLSVPLDDILSYPKLSKSYFAFLEILFRSHIGVVLSLDTPTLMQILNGVHEGLQSSDAPLSSACATTIDHLSTFYFNNINKTHKPEVIAMQQHVATQPSLFPSLTSTLFNLLLFGSAANHWAVMRPMLSLMLASSESFTQYKDQLMASQTPENRPLLAGAFDKLLEDVSGNLESQNRDRFTQKLTAFRISARSFLTL
jgi:exportin-7